MPSIRIDHQSFCCWKDFCRWNWGLLPNKKKRKRKKAKNERKHLPSNPKKSQKEKRIKKIHRRPTSKVGNASAAQGFSLSTFVCFFGAGTTTATTATTTTATTTTATTKRTTAKRETSDSSFISFDVSHRNKKKSVFFLLLVFK